MIRSLVQHAILETHAKNAQNFAVDELVALELHIRLKDAHMIICVALINGRHATELFMVPRVLLLVRLDDFLYGEEKKLRNLVLSIKHDNERLMGDDCW